MLICIDAGHYMGTPGKRCLKSIDPRETREWALNARIADKLQARLAAYDCTAMRVDDTTGAREVTLQARVKAANDAGADVYLSIHHNAGINGGSGGGIVVFVAPGAQAASKTLQRAVYSHTVAATGLRGNRANPTPAGVLYVLNNTKMPAILGEFGFMDSTTDVPIILTDKFATQIADGITAALVEVYNLKEIDDMTDAQIRAIVRQELAAIEAERANLPANDWAAEKLAAAKEHHGITDATRPQSYATRQEVALMVASNK